MEATIPKQFDRLYKLAFGFAVFTIVFNVIEGSVATYFGFSDESLALFGFGVDSFIEVISGIGIAHLIWRTQKSGESQSDDFERTALRITGFAFTLWLSVFRQRRFTTSGREINPKRLFGAW